MVFQRLSINVQTWTSPSLVFRFAMVDPRSWVSVVLTVYAETTHSGLFKFLAMVTSTVEVAVKLGVPPSLAIISIYNETKLFDSTQYPEIKKAKKKFFSLMLFSCIHFERADACKCTGEFNKIPLARKRPLQNSTECITFPTQDHPWHIDSFTHIKWC